MDALTSVLVIILCIGLTQGFVFAVILWKKSNKELQANKFKAILLIVISYELLNQVLRLFDIGYYDIWYHLTLDLEWSYGPLLYLYVRALVTPDLKLNKKDLWIFYPIILQIICSVYVRSQNFLWDGTKESLSWLGYHGYAYWMNYSTVPIIASILIIYFSVKSVLLLKALKPHEVDQKNFRWVFNLVRSFGIYYFLVLVILIVDLIVYLNTISIDYYYFTRFYYYPFFIGLAILGYWFGISSVIRDDQSVLKIRKKLSDSERQILEELTERLHALMVVNKVYKESTLTLNALAEKLDTKAYLITKAMNDIIHKSFTDYVNEHRVSEVQRLIKEPENNKYTLLSLAYQAGFNSKSSFNRAVKKHLGISPSDLK